MAGTSAQQAALDKAGCSGHSTVRLVLDDLGPYVRVHGHRLWKTGPYVWCALCGSHAHLRIRGLDGRCRGKLVSTSGGVARGRANLRAGRAPKAKVGDEPAGVPVRLTLHQWLVWKGILADLAVDGGAAGGVEGVGQVLDEYGAEGCDEPFGL